MTSSGRPGTGNTTTFIRVKWTIEGPEVSGVNDKLLQENVDGDEEEVINPFPTTGFLGDVDITPVFDTDKPEKDPFNIIQPAFTIKAKLQEVTRTEEVDGYGTPTGSVNFTFEDIPYSVNSLTITSRHESNPRWIFPNDFEGVEVLPGTPKEYGGIVLEDAKSLPTTKAAGEVTSCGSDGKSGYQYLDVFFNYDFKYLPRNSIGLSDGNTFDPKDVKSSRDRFPTRPILPNVVDEDNLKAPILPIDMVTSYAADDRESYNVIYTITFSGAALFGFPRRIENPVLTVTQTVTQDLDAIGSTLQSLLGISTFNYLSVYSADFEEMAPEYPFSYPYTVVSGFDGQPIQGTPTSRNIIEGESEGPLQKGDIWYSDVTKERKYYQVNSFVESVKILQPGTIYRGSAQPTDFSSLLQQNTNFMKALDNITNNVDKYLDGDTTGALRGLRGNSSTFEEASIIANDNIPLQKRKNLTTYAVKEVNGQFELSTENSGSGLTIDADVNKDGGIVRATIVNPGTGYKNGDKVAVFGGDCILEVSVNTDEFWTDQFVDRLGRDKELLLF